MGASTKLKSTYAHYLPYVSKVALDTFGASTKLKSSSAKLFPLYDQGGAGHMSLGALTKLKSSEIISPYTSKVALSIFGHCHGQGSRVAR